MDFVEIIVELNANDIERACAIANMVAPYGLYIEDYSDLEKQTKEIAHIDIIDDKLLSKNKKIALIHIYFSSENNFADSILFLENRFNICKIKNKISTKKCKAQDYINNWKKYFKPVEIGKNLLICPSWKKHDMQKPSERILLEIDPGLAFGTGTHETTKLCLELIENYVTNSTKLLDIGCGSGILSIASILLGAKSATGVDIDELSVKTAIENAKINKVEDKFNVICGDLTEKISKKFNLVVANIVADIIIDLNKNIKNYMSEKSVYIMSGIIEPYKNDVIRSLKDNFDVIDIKSKNSWFAIVAQPKV